MAKLITAFLILFVFNQVAAHYACNDLFVTSPQIINFRRWLREAEAQNSSQVIVALKNPEQVEVYADATLAVINEWFLLTDTLTNFSRHRLDFDISLPEHNRTKTTVALRLLLDNSSERLLRLIDKLDRDMNDLVIYHPSLLMLEAASEVIYQAKIQKYQIKKIEDNSQSRVRKIYFRNQKI